MIEVSRVGNHTQTYTVTHQMHPKWIVNFISIDPRTHPSQTHQACARPCATTPPPVPINIRPGETRKQVEGTQLPYIDIFFENCYLEKCFSSWVFLYKIFVIINLYINIQIWMCDLKMWFEFKPTAQMRISLPMQFIGQSTWGQHKSQ